MGRLIDVDEYEKRIKPYDTEDVMDKALYNFAHDHLVTTPTAQPEIIRCKDCKYYRWEINMCDEPFSTAHNVVHEYDYCSKAERKTDG